jgi:hypothetical protein
MASDKRQAFVAQLWVLLVALLAPMAFCRPLAGWQRPRRSWVAARREVGGAAARGEAATAQPQKRRGEREAQQVASKERRALAARM